MSKRIVIGGVAIWARVEGDSLREGEGGEEEEMRMLPQAVVRVCGVALEGCLQVIEEGVRVLFFDGGGGAAGGCREARWC